MPRISDIAKILVIGAAFACCSSARGLCGSLDSNGRSKAGPVQKQYFLYRFDDTWKKVSKLPAEIEPDGGEVAWLSTDSTGWSMAWIFISSPDWIWTTTYCFSPTKSLSKGESRFSCAWDWIARQSISLVDGDVHKSKITFIDNKTYKEIWNPDGADEFRADYDEFEVYRKVGELPFARVLSKTGAVK